MLRWNWLNSKVVVMNHAKTSDTINRTNLLFTNLYRLVQIYYESNQGLN